MANLLYICPNQKLTDNSLCIELASAMLSCSHNVRLLTTYTADNEDFETPRKLQYLMPFKKWSVVEMPKIFLSTHGFAPDVVHFFLNSSEAASMKPLLMSLPSYFKSLYGAKLVLHLENSIPRRSMAFSQWMHQADLVITQDHFQLLKASALFESSPSQTFMTLSSELAGSLVSHDFEWLESWFDNYVYVAGSITSVDEAIAIIKSCEYLLKGTETRGMVLNIENMKGGLSAETLLRAFLQDNFFDRSVCLVRSLNQKQNIELIQSCSHYFIAHLGVEPSHMNLALDTVLNSQQIAVCTAQQAYFIRNTANRSLKLQECKLGRPLIDEIHQVYLTENEQPEQAVTSFDLANRLNRAYQQILGTS